MGYLPKYRISLSGWYSWILEILDSPDLWLMQWTPSSWGALSLALPANHTTISFKFHKEQWHNHLGSNEHGWVRMNMDGRPLLVSIGMGWTTINIFKSSKMYSYISYLGKTRFKKKSMFFPMLRIKPGFWFSTQKKVGSWCQRYIYIYRCIDILTFFPACTGHPIWHSFGHSIWDIFWRTFWHLFWHSIWCPSWHSVWHELRSMHPGDMEFRSRHGPLRPELAEKERKVSHLC